MNALELLAAHGDKAKVLSGGQSLMPAMNLRLISPEFIVDIGELAELRGIAVNGDLLTIGALTRHVDVLKSPEIAAHAPSAKGRHLSCRSSRDPQSRYARGQPCARGSRLRTASLYGSARRYHCCSRAARRATVPANEFFTGIYETTLLPQELIVAIEMAVARTASAHFFDEFARRHGDYAIVGLAAQAIVRNEQFANLRLGFFAVGDQPLLAEALLVCLLTSRLRRPVSAALSSAIGRNSMVS